MTDHYTTLGIKQSATIAEIKKAYRSLAFRYHPDKNPDDHLSEARFKDIQQAYSILSDSSKRAAYDDERWLSGMGNRQVQEVTPQWLEKIAKELNATLATMDTHRMSQKALRAYILMILTDAHMAILQQYNDARANNAIIIEILKAVKRLEIKYLDEIEQRLILLAGNNTDMLQAIDNKIEERKRNALFDKMLPYFIIIITLVLCICMYYYASL